MQLHSKKDAVVFLKKYTLLTKLIQIGEQYYLLLFFVSILIGNVSDGDIFLNETVIYGVLSVENTEWYYVFFIYIRLN